MASRQILRQTFSKARLLVPTATTRAVISRHAPLCKKSHLKSHNVVNSATFHTSARKLNEHIVNIQDEEDFKTKVLDNANPVIVDFHAHWCGPCKILGPRLESLISGRDGKVIMAKVDIDENSDLAIFHGVEAVPTVLAVKDGKVVDKFVGVKDDSDLEKFVDKLTGE